AFEPRVDGHQRAEILERLAGDEDAPRRQALQLPLAGVVRNPGGVVEMRVRDEDVGDGEQRVRTAADVEPDVQLANAKPGLVSGPRPPLDREVLGGKDELLLVAHEAVTALRPRSGAARRWPAAARGGREWSRRERSSSRDRRAARRRSRARRG